MDEVNYIGTGPRKKPVKPIVLCGAIVLGIIVLCVLYIYISFAAGYRLSPMQAAKANDDILGDAELIEEIDLGWGKCYLFQTPDQFLVADCEKDGLLWRCPLTSHGDRRADDGLATLAYFGWAKAENKVFTIFAIENTDPQVAYIEAGPGLERSRQAATLDTIVVFQWTYTRISVRDLAAHALDAEGRVIYEYRYADRGRADNRVLLWYPVNDPSQVWYPADEVPEVS
jgi:hypothetical protein